MEEVGRKIIRKREFAVALTIPFSVAGVTLKEKADFTLPNRDMWSTIAHGAPPC